uniref:SJCHGC04484 protein n=1 Tax=Schistosoma japonicum TaxID=6182 RepID=Q5DGW2_SCHJA|nr:SJCHGC04484 protein [Schistosoma japonicum]
MNIEFIIFIVQLVPLLSSFFKLIPPFLVSPFHYHVCSFLHFLLIHYFYAPFLVIFVVYPLQLYSYFHFTLCMYVLLRFHRCLTYSITFKEFLFLFLFYMRLDYMAPLLFYKRTNTLPL